MFFEWDDQKSSRNYRKHGVSFEEARTVFFDEYARLISDRKHSDVEERFVILGLSGMSRVILAAHCYREYRDVIRIISARKATKTERSVYWSYRK